MFCNHNLNIFQINATLREKISEKIDSQKWKWMLKFKFQNDRYLIKNNRSRILSCLEITLTVYTVTLLFLVCKSYEILC